MEALAARETYSKLDSLDLALKLTSLIGGDGGRDDGT